MSADTPTQDALTAVREALEAEHVGHEYDWQCIVCTKDFEQLARVATSAALGVQALSCGCCGLCGAPPGHQHPSTVEAWRHVHTVEAGERHG